MMIQYNLCHDEFGGSEEKVLNSKFYNKVKHCLKPEVSHYLLFESGIVHISGKLNHLRILVLSILYQRLINKG